MEQVAHGKHARLREVGGSSGSGAGALGTTSGDGEHSTEVDPRQGAVLAISQLSPSRR